MTTENIATPKHHGPMISRRMTLSIRFTRALPVRMLSRNSLAFVVFLQLLLFRDLVLDDLCFEWIAAELLAEIVLADEVVARDLFSGARGDDVAIDKDVIAVRDSQGGRHVVIG